MEVNLLRTDKSESKMGHGVLFYYSISDKEDKIAVAFLDGYSWLHTDPGSVDVLLFALDPAKCTEIGRTEDEVVSAVIDYVNRFLENKGKIEAHGRISTWWNA